MRVEETEIGGVLHILPRVRRDDRGFFVETFHARRYAARGVDVRFVQDNLSRSAPGTLRGLHLQHPHGQAKLVGALEGSVFDVAVDLRVGSPTFGQHVARVLDSRRKNQLFIPAGFAHGFCVLGDAPALFAYKCTDFHHPEHELRVAFDDPALGIAWPLSGAPCLSTKDREAPPLAALERGRLPRYEP